MKIETERTEFEFVINNKSTALAVVAQLIRNAAKKRGKLTIGQRQAVGNAAYVAATALGQEAQSKAYSDVMAVTA